MKRTKRDDYEGQSFSDVYQEDDLKLDHYPNVSECRAILKRFAKQQYWPNVFVVNDHGNADLLRVGYNGAKIVKSWV